MIEYADALKLVKQKAHLLPVEKVNLLDALNRVLTKDIISDMNMPPFNKSAVDGYACKKKDLGKNLEILEIIYAGSSPKFEIKDGQCSKIMTGACVPNGADCVFMIEEAELLSDKTVCCINEKCKTNICYLGEDVTLGSCVLKKGTFITAKHIPVLAGAGISSVEVYQKPKIGVFATGSELVDVDAFPNPFQIRNSNSYQIMAQISELGIDAIYEGIVIDDKSETSKALKSSQKKYDVSIFTGGVSVGDLDLLPDLLKEHDFETILSNTAIQPGKPIVFAKKGEHFFFGLSGNPVSSFIQFMLYAKPFIYKMMGFDYKPVNLILPLSVMYKRKKKDRLQFVPAIINHQGMVEPLPFHGSAHINALSNANCLFEVPKGKSSIMEGEKVNIRLI